MHSDSPGGGQNPNLDSLACRLHRFSTPQKFVRQKKHDFVGEREHDACDTGRISFHRRHPEFGEISREAPVVVTREHEKILLLWRKVLPHLVGLDVQIPSSNPG